MECDVNLEVDKELQSYIDAMPCKESRKALQKKAVILKEKSIEDDARYSHLQNLIRDIIERVRKQERYRSKDWLIINNPPPMLEKWELKNFLRTSKTFAKTFWFMISLKVIWKHITCHCRDMLSPNVYCRVILCPSVILKFVQYHVKDKVYKLRRFLKADSKKPLPS